MEKRWTLSRMYSRLLGNHPIAFVASLCTATLAQGAFAYGQDIPAPPADITTPSQVPLPHPIELVPAAHVRPAHAAWFSVGDQYYVDGVAGLRAYLETIRPTNGPLYAQLAPDLERLEAKRTTAYAAMLTGVGAGVAAGVLAAVTWQACSSPSVFDPNFARKINDWATCNEANQTRLATFATIGLGTVLAGLVTAMVVAPHDADIVAFVNRHNRLVGAPLDLGMGFDPQSHLAFGHATLAF